MRKNLALGLAFGLVGAAGEAVACRMTGGAQVFGLCDAAIISAALFFGRSAGVGALIACVLGRLGLLSVSGSAIVCLTGCIGSLFAMLLAFAFRRWMFFDARPAAVPAALFAAICSLAEPFVYLLLEFAGVEIRIAVLVRTMIASCSAAAAVAFFLSLVLRVPQPLRTNVVALGAIAALGTFSAVLGMVQGVGAERAAFERAQVLKDDATTAVDYPIEPELLHEARVAVRQYGKVEALASAGACAEIAQRNDYVFVAAVGKDGKILASSRPQSVGFDFHSDAFTREYLCLNEGESYQSQPFHEQPAAFSDGTDYLCKYIGTPFPDGGFIFIGETLANLVFRDYLFHEMMIDWHVGTSGSLVLADPTTGKILSGYDYDKIGMTLKDSGLADLRFDDPEVLARGRVFGVDTFVKRQPLDFVPLDVYILMPAADILTERDLTVVVSILVLALVYALGAMLFGKITKQNADLAMLRANEDAARKRDMELARDIQTSALPSVFSPFGACDAFDLFAHMRTAKEVGGDFFDFYPAGNGKLCLVIADVSDKGVPAAMFMMKAKAVINAEMQRSPSDLAAVMAAVNDALVDNNVAGMFVTTWIGVYDLGTGELVSVSAGHNPPYLRRAGGAIEEMRHPRGLVVGCMSGRSYKTTSITLAPGDVLFLYTDGVTEAKNSAGELFGEARLTETLAECSSDAKNTCERVVSAVDAFAGSAPQADDITVMTLIRRR